MDEVPVQEVAAMLAELAEDSPTSLLHACRRLIEHFPASGQLWWLSARALSAPETVEGIWEAADELVQDPTPAALAKAVPEGASVSLLRPSSHAIVQALRPRKQAAGRPNARPNPNARKANDAEKRSRGTGHQLVVVPALAAGPDALLVHDAAAHQLVAHARSGRALWAVLPKGVVLPGPLWEELLRRASAAGGTQEVAPEAFATFVGPGGLTTASDLLSAPECPPVAELLGWHS